MNPDQLARVQSTYASIRERPDTLAASFYRELFAAAPEVRPLFPEDIAELRAKFVEELDEIVACVSRLPALLDRAGDLGRRHVDYGVQTSHYDLVGAALLTALATELGDDFDEETRDAWTLAYNLVAETMMRGAADRP